MAFLIVSFIAGVLTVLAPCVLPLLPVIVGSTATARSPSTPYVVVGSLAASIVAFTFVLKVSTAFVMIPPEAWTYLSGGILTLFGLTLVFPAVWESLPGISALSVSSNKFLGAGYTKKSFWGDVIVGAALGPVFSTCSPTYFVILASVLPVSFLLGTIYILAYVLGLGLVLLLIALLGERLVQRLGGFADPRGYFKRVVGVLFVLLGLMITFGIEKALETSIINSGVFDITKVEQQLLNSVGPVTEARGVKYRELVDPAGFVNSAPFKLADVVGKKVILLDFVTYSCINCQRTFPYLNKWYSEYEDDGLMIVGIHTPEFAFEHDINNVTEAAKKFGLKFPLVLDNDYGTWNAYGNNYWPRKYLIDIRGNIVYDHIGEGNYDETEAAIVAALNDRKKFLAEGGTVVGKMDVPADANKYDLNLIKSPETYLGGARAQYLVNAPSSACASGTCTYSYKGTDVPQGYQLKGSWTTDKEFITLDKGDGAIRISFNANKVNLVAGAGQAVRARVLLDGKDLGTMLISTYDLYILADLKGAAGNHVLEVQFLDPGVKAYAFTFG